jgi:hypothetical protein
LVYVKPPFAEMQIMPPRYPKRAPGAEVLQRQVQAKSLQSEGCKGSRAKGKSPD